MYIEEENLYINLHWIHDLVINKFKTFLGITPIYKAYYKSESALLVTCNTILVFPSSPEVFPGASTEYRKCTRWIIKELQNILNSHFATNIWFESAASITSLIGPLSEC